MPSLLIIRLHPEEPIAGDDFTAYLDNLTIEAHEVSFNDPTGSGPAFGSASYIAPNLPPSPSPDPTPTQDADTRIVQHYSIAPMLPPGDFVRHFAAIATAIIEIPTPPAGGEHRTADVRLVIKRGADETLHKQIYFNVPVSNLALPGDPNNFVGMEPISLHLALASPAQSGSVIGMLPEDGTAPNFAVLRTAIENVLNAEPGHLNNIAELSRTQAKHIAYEIIWDRLAYPLPLPPRPLEEIYTGPQDASSDNERDRRIFEGNLLTYYTRHNAEADRLANFVFAVSAAIWCEQKTQSEPRVGFYFPVLPGEPSREAKVILTGVGGAALDPQFVVPAEYFYALTAVLPPQVAREQRYRMVQLEAEGQLVIDIEAAIEDDVFTEPATVNRFQTARRLRALAATGEAGTPEYEVTPGGLVQGLVTHWLARTDADISLFWNALAAADVSGQLELVLCAVTQQHLPLVNVIKQPAFGVNAAGDLKAKTNQDWYDLLLPDPTLLPDFTKPGTTEERTQAFIRHLRKFFDVPNVFDAPAAPVINAAQQLGRSPNPLDTLLSIYPGFTFSGWDQTQLGNALSAIFPDDINAQQDFFNWLWCIRGLINLTQGIVSEDMQFAVMEALWARGLTSSSLIAEFAPADFQEALTGSIAYDFAGLIWNNAQVAPPNPEAPPGPFQPVNPGTLVNCIPPLHRSPLGPVAYLHELLRVSPDSTCTHPLPSDVQTRLANLVATRRGPLTDLLATAANLDVPLPVIDLVNESLEHMVDSGNAFGAVFNTASDQVGGHLLRSHPSPTADAFLHSPETLLETLPEHSTSFVPTKAQGAYDKLKVDFSACTLPYHQPLDVSRTYLRQLGTRRYETMRRFRRDITEFVLDPAGETAEFQKHLWRYPVRIETAIEYLCLTPEEYTTLFQPLSEQPVSENTPPAGATRGRRRARAATSTNSNSQTLHHFYGFESANGGDGEGQPWTQVVLQLDEFLARSCLSYCEFLALWKSKFVEFRPARGRANDNEADRQFPECEPCCLAQYRIDFGNRTGIETALWKLFVFIRLWRKLQCLPNAKYSFDELRDICEVLELFQGNTVNPHFIRQLAAFQMLRDDFQLPLTDITTPFDNATGAERSHLLALWVPGASRWDWAVGQLLDSIQRYAMAVHHCGCRPPEFIKLLQQNLNALSALAGFDPATATDSWHAHPTHTLRFAEILAKIYASEFGVGELLFLFTTQPHLRGDDPFPLQTDNEAGDSPFGLPDDDECNSLFTLRKKLLAVEIDTEQAEHWSWAQMDSVLREEFGFVPQPADNAWQKIGQHFFPNMLAAASGIPVTPAQRQYRVALAATSEPMWNTPFDGPFRYDAAAGELWTQIPLTDEAVLAKLSRIRQLSPSEQIVVRDLYFQPRAELVRFAFIFDNFGEAEERLIQEPDEAQRWAWFQQQFARFHRRCTLIAEHLAEHVDCATGLADGDSVARAKLLLKHLWADENSALTPWEDDSGMPPTQLRWQPRPNSGAYAALLGLGGTGLVAEYRNAESALRWREMRGGLEAFGPEENRACAPLPGVLPTLDFTLTPAQLRVAAIRNGFAIANTDGTLIGGAEPFRLQWQGLLLIETGDNYAFAAGAPTPAGEKPNFDAIADTHRWRVILRRGQKTWVLLAHDWVGEEAPAHCAEAITLRKGFYEILIEFQRKPLVLDDDSICPHITGFQLKYKGCDSAQEWLAVPYDKLFQSQKDVPLNQGLEDISDAQRDFLAEHFTSSVRDIRRTYQRAFKALLLVNRLHLSPQPVADDGQSELAYLLAQPDHFAGQSYYRDGGGFTTHRAFFDMNFLPVRDNYATPSAGDDDRVAPSAQRQQALFDWWERLFDYTEMRAQSRCTPEQPTWLLFHEAAETHADNPAHLLRHLGIDLRHVPLVLAYFDATEADLAYEVTSEDLEDDRWAVRVWTAETWVRQLRQRFYPRDITSAQPYLWASDGPALEGNANLTQFYRDGCIENSDPRRYKEIKQLNDALRERGRRALIAWLTRMNRVALPWGGFAQSAKDLSDLLLQDVDAGLCQRASRIEDAILALQTFVQRARLGLEPSFVPDAAFIQVWDSQFASFREWESCARRRIYQENWVEWEELKKAQKSEAFQFLETELRRATLTLPVPGGLAYWSGARPPAHPGITLLQHREPAVIGLLDQPQEGLGLLGHPDRHARPSWLAPIRGALGGPRDPNPENPDTPGVPTNPDGPTTPAGVPVVRAINLPPPAGTVLPLWLQAAVRLGTRFIRIAAASVPPASTNFSPKCQPQEQSICCCTCGKTHSPLMDEYYFWLEDARHFTAQEQVAEWGAIAEDTAAGISGDPLTDWHRDETLPGLLHWESASMVRLRWCRVHNGEFQQPRTSHEGVRVMAGSLPELEFTGRRGDSLNFTVIGGTTPIGFPPPPAPGFRYDIAPDEAIVVPEIAPAPLPPLFGGLAAFPFFAWFEPGAPVLPLSMFSEAIAVAGHLRAHCRFEPALKWYELVYSPLLHDNRWADCADSGNGETPVPSTTGAAPTPVPVSTPNPCCCPSDPVELSEQQQRAILLHYLETLMQWSDALLRKHTPENIQRARLLIDTAARILGATPDSLRGTSSTHPPQSVGAFEPDCAPLNPRLLCLYTAVEDRLAVIHSCLNVKRLKNGRPNLDMPFFGNSTLRDNWKSLPTSCADEADWCLPQSCYRFLTLVQKAQELASEVRGLGNALLSAYEKGDGEYLATLRTMHERQLIDLALDVRQLQWREADWLVQSWKKSKEIAQTRLHYYNMLIANGLIDGEVQYEPLTISSSTVRTAGNISVAIGQFMNLIPDPHVGFPCNFVKLPPGEKLSAIFSGAGTIANTVAEIINTAASLGLTKSGWDRREDEWQHQVDVLTVEIEQIEQQILAAERRRDAALHELNMQQRQSENATEINNFLRDKFTSHGLYLWMQQETAALYYRMYELALNTARQAQRAFNYERGHTARNFIPAELWDNLHEGLLAGDRLQLAVKQMEKAYYDENCREYELTKHISLRLHAPAAFLQLKLTGSCELELPEWMFDLDYPGHYLRRIKMVSLSVPCVVGPYTGIHCRMTLLSSATRVDARLMNIRQGCCDEVIHSYCCEDVGGYEAVADDPRIVKHFAATEAIATSNGQRDGGMFELNFRDERYLPFEFAGAVSRWRIELPAENNRFDMESLSDFILHLNYTAREGGENLRKAASQIAQAHLPDDGMRLFDVRQELPDAWSLFTTDETAKSRKLRLKLSRAMFPFLPGHRDVHLHRLSLVIEAKGASPSAHRIVRFVRNDGHDYVKGKWDCCDAVEMACIATADWPCFYQGVLDMVLGPLSGEDTCELGTFLFPEAMGPIERMYLMCFYEASPPEGCKLEPGIFPIACNKLEPC